MLDENEFLSPHGIRSLSRYHADHPYVLNVQGQTYGVSYLPAESDSGMFGGNSNWRGPIWMPVNGLIVRALLHYYSYYGDERRRTKRDPRQAVRRIRELVGRGSNRMATTWTPTSVFDCVSRGQSR